MRRLTALALFVSSFYVTLHAGTPGTVSDWRELHDRALAAVDRKDKQTALSLLMKCNETAHTPFERGISATDLGTVLYRAGQAKEALPWLRQAQEYWFGMPDSFARLARTSVALAQAARQVGGYVEAEQALRGALAIAPPETTADTPDREARCLALEELGDMLRETGRSAESRALLVEAGRIPGVSWQRMVDSKVGLAELDRDSHQWEESLEEWSDVGELGRDHGDTQVQAVASRGLGETWLEKGNPARAEPLLRSALATFDVDPVGNEVEIASTLACMGQLYMGENKLAMAEDVLTKALESDERTFGETHPQTAIMHEMLGDTLARRNQMELARDHMNRAVRILAGAFGERSSMVGSALASWGVIEQRSHNPARAVEIFEKSLANLRPGESPEVDTLKVFVMQHYANALKAIHHKDQASAVLAQMKGFQAK
jgi:tetratricopeptide (TPR) repeat protein